MDKTMKSKALADLAKARKEACWPGYAQVGDYHSGNYDSDHVSPYTRGAGNVNSKVFVLLQDWSSHEALSKEFDPETKRLGYTEDEPTNMRLLALLRDNLGMRLDQVYATNLFPFIKPGNMSTRIPDPVLKRAALEYAIPQIEIVRPSVVVCLGTATFNAMRRACGKTNAKNIDHAAQCVFRLGDAEVWCQAHTGALGRINRNRGGVDRVSHDWARMAHAVGFGGLDFRR